MGNDNFPVRIGMDTLDPEVYQRIRRNNVGRSLHAQHFFVDQQLGKLHLHIRIAVAEHIHQEGLFSQRRLHLVDFLSNHFQPLTAGAVGTHAARFTQSNGHIRGRNAIGHGTAIERVF